MEFTVDSFFSQLKKKIKFSDVKKQFYKPV